MPRYDKDVTDCLHTTSLVFLCNSITHWETKPCYFLCLWIVVSQQHQWLLVTLLTNQITVLDFLITISLLAYQQDPWLPSDSCCSSHDKACPPLDSGSPHWCLPHPVTKSNRKHIIHGIHQNKIYLLLNTWTSIRFLRFLFFSFDNWKFGVSGPLWLIPITETSKTLRLQSVDLWPFTWTNDKPLFMGKDKVCSKLRENNNNIIRMGSLSRKN